MTLPRRRQIRLAAAAETDFRDMLRWTVEHFGERQAHVYAETLTEAIEALAEGPDLAGSRERNDIGDGLPVLHIAPGGRKGRCFVPTPKPIHPQSTCSAYYTTPWICPTTIRRNGGRSQNLIALRRLRLRDSHL